MHATLLVISILLSDPTDVDRGTKSGTLEAPRIVESSGVAAGLKNRGMFWTHNDSGDGPNLYLIDASGRHHATWHLAGAGAVDWEDICSFRAEETSWLAVADTGDNRRRREHVSLYVFEEPGLPPVDAQRHTQRLKEYRRIDFTYRDGPRDCEGVGFDPISHQFIFVTKQPSGGPAPFPGPAEIYLLPLAIEPGPKPLVMNPVGSIPGLQVTAAAVRPDGGGLLLLTYRNAVWYRRKTNQPWAEVVAAKRGRWIPMPFRRAGEAICFEPDGKAIFLTSEGAKQPLWRRAAPSEDDLAEAGGPP